MQIHLSHQDRMIYLLYLSQSFLMVGLFTDICWALFYLMLGFLFQQEIRSYTLMVAH